MRQSQAVGDSKIVTGSLDLGWEIIGAIVSGASAIDLARLDLASAAQAEDFLAAYGFDPRTEDGQKEIAKIMPLALAFLADELLPVGGYNQLPRDVPRDPVSLLLIASQVDHPLRDWSCSLLRICHVVAHSLYLPGRDHVREALNQVEERLGQHLAPDGPGYRLGGIPLVRVTFKREKPWNSLLLKLLCKKDSVAEEIYDQVGCRIVTQSKADALGVVRYLREKAVIVFPNIKPSRSHNTLIDLPDFRRFVMGAWADLEMGKLTSDEFEAKVQTYDREPDDAPGSAPWNRYSDEHYRSIQFTARVLVTHHQGGSTERFFFPFEVQIMDEAAYERNMVGKPNHHAYRERQRDDARKRVFPWIRVPASGANRR